jgi:hypothetical protein
MHDHGAKGDDVVKRASKRPMVISAAAPSRSLRNAPRPISQSLQRRRVAHYNILKNAGPAQPTITKAPARIISLTQLPQLQRGSFARALTNAAAAAMPLEAAAILDPAVSLVASAMKTSATASRLNGRNRLLTSNFG